MLVGGRVAPINWCIKLVYATHRFREKLDLYKINKGVEITTTERHAQTGHTHTVMSHTLINLRPYRTRPDCLLTKVSGHGQKKI